MAGQRMAAGGSQQMNAPRLVKQVTQNRTLDETDYSRILECTGSITLTVDTNVTPRQFQAVIVNMGVGVITVAAANGSILSKDSAVTIAEQYAAASIYESTPSTWVLLGDIA